MRPFATRISALKAVFVKIPFMEDGKQTRITIRANSRVGPFAGRIRQVSELATYVRCEYLPGDERGLNHLSQPRFR